MQNICKTGKLVFGQRFEKNMEQRKRKKNELSHQGVESEAK